MGKRAVLSVSEKKAVCAYRNQFPVASQQNTANHVALLWDKPISLYIICIIDDTMSANNKWENLASANIKKVKGAKHEKLEEALTIWIRLHAKNGTAADKVIKKAAMMISSTVHYYCIKSFYNMLICDRHLFIILDHSYKLKNLQCVDLPQSLIHRHKFW